MHHHRFSDALSWAAQLHAGQVRKHTDVPYVAHVMAVAALVLEDGGTEDEAIAALLHDAIEDCGVTRGQIAERFGEEVAGVVAACSDTDQQPKPPWLGRKKAYLAHLESASPSALRVSAADKLHNVSAMIDDYHRVGEQLWKRFGAQPDRILWFYDSVATVMTERLDGSTLPRRLERAVRELHAATGRPQPNEPVQ